ncbi:MAG TPA: ATP-binding protein [Bacteroidota bacterium]|nr:ATP-binding protein [Bacteroidota bacterium]
MVNPLSGTLPRSSRLKIFLLALAFLIAAGTLWYTHEIVQLLLARERKLADLYAKSLQYLSEPTETGGDYSFIFEEVIQAIDFPIVLTDASNEPIPPYHANAKNIKLDTTWSLEEQRAYLKNLILELDSYHPPLKVTFRDTIVLNYVHFGESPLVTQLRWLPYIEIGVVAIFIFIGYISFSYIKKSEQSNVWVGMARETAHQLGTPLSSMMGWVELLRHQTQQNPQMLETLRDMENDLRRLQKIADRFSKIGSKPDLREVDVTEIIQKTFHYFERRIPQSGKKVALHLASTAPISARVNSELFEWVIENLIKNALDAIENGEGKISVSIAQTQREVWIDVSDTGKGIDVRYRQDIFRPGFSTKSRGWGLGLSLAQRIIESHHNGKLELRESKPGVGTTFRIRLKK